MKELASELIVQTAVLREMEANLVKQKKLVESLKIKVIHSMKEFGTLTYRMKGATITMESKDRPQASDWDKLYQYIHANYAFDLLHRRLSSTAYKDRSEDGEKIEGVTLFKDTIIKVRL